MTPFQSLFGIKASQIKKNCLIVPFSPKGFIKYLNIPPLVKAKLFAISQSQNFTLIQTGISASFVGDAVLHLEDTPCKNIVFFGSCGLVPPSSQHLNIGSIVSPTSALDITSFSQMLNNTFTPPQRYRANTNLLNNLLTHDSSQKTQKVACASVGSLKLEEAILPFLIKNKITIIDMECSAVFHAAKKIKRKAAALLFITDIIHEKPFYQSPTPTDQSAINTAIKQSALILSRILNDF